MRGSRIPFAVCLVLLLGVVMTGWNGQAQDRIGKETSLLMVGFPIPVPPCHLPATHRNFSKIG